MLKQLEGNRNSGWFEGPWCYMVALWVIGFYKCYQELNECLVFLQTNEKLVNRIHQMKRMIRKFKQERGSVVFLFQYLSSCSTMGSFHVVIKYNY